MGPEHKVNQSKERVLDEAQEWSEAFYYLTASRPMGMDGPIPIPVSEVDAYCRLIGTPQLERQAFLRMIRRLDIGYLELIEKQRSQKKVGTDV